MIDAKKFVVHYFNKTNIKLPVDRLNSQIMDFLKKGSLEAAKKAIEKVYFINRLREQVIDLPEFLQTIKIRSVDKWSFEVYIDESDLIFSTKANKPIFEINAEEDRGRGGTDRVSNLSEYFKSPINDLVELDYTRQEIDRAVNKFMGKDFIDFLKKTIGGK